VVKRGRRTHSGDTAATIGRAFGRVAARVDALKRQRAVVAAEVQSVIHAAQRMLAELGGTGSAGGSSTGRGTSPARRKPRLSPEARERIAEAQRRRWAKVRAAKNKK
jgi:hypothetical protein